MNCVILGGFGFLGSHLCDHLLELGHKVRLFDRFEARNDNVQHVLNQVEVMQGDFANERELCQAVEGMDIIYHLVSSTHPKSSNEDPYFDLASNLLPTVRLLEFLKYKQDSKVIFFSSGGTVYGIPEQVPIPEDHPTAPICSYGIHKLAIEKYLHFYCHVHGMNCAIMRVANPFGERQRPDHVQGAVAVFMDRVLKGAEIEIWGDGSVVRDFVYIKDVMTVAGMLAEYAGPMHVFNVGSGQGHSLLDLLSAIQVVTGITPKVRYTPGRASDVPSNVLDITRLNQALGWSPAWTLEAGLRRLMQSKTD